MPKQESFIVPNDLAGSDYWLAIRLVGTSYKLRGVEASAEVSTEQRIAVASEIGKALAQAQIAVPIPEEMAFQHERVVGLLRSESVRMSPELFGPHMQER